MKTTSLPADDRRRPLVLVDPDGPVVSHISLVGDTYTVLVSGKDTKGNYCLIDMHIPPGGGPPPHRHNFEESFTVLTGELEVSFRDEKLVVRSGQTAQIPANAPHQFKNRSSSSVRLLCICAPAGLEEFFAALGTPVPSRTTSLPPPDPALLTAAKAKAERLAPRFQTEFLPIDSH